jgi:hypothetical protein
MKFGTGHYYKYNPQQQIQNDVKAIRVYQIKKGFGAVQSGNDALKARLLPYGFNSKN